YAARQFRGRVRGMLCPFSIKPACATMRWNEVAWTTERRESMSLSASSFDLSAALAQLDAAAAAGKVTSEAAQSMRAWLKEPRYAEYAPEVARQITAGLWKQLDDVFWTVIPFGTGGRRGKMYPIGSNAINDRTIGESAQGLADYIHSQFPGRNDL